MKFIVLMCILVILTLYLTGFTNAKTDEDQTTTTNKPNNGILGAVLAGSGNKNEKGNKGNKDGGSDNKSGLLSAGELAKSLVGGATGPVGGGGTGPVGGGGTGPVGGLLQTG